MSPVRCHTMDSMLIDGDIKNQLLQHISCNDEAHFKSQQVGDPDLTQSEKYTIAEGILDKSKSTFLSKYGKYLLDEHLTYFEGSEDYEINFYLGELQKGKKSVNKVKNTLRIVNKSQVRNRRLEALRQLCEKGEYFSDDEMKRRNPLLYEELVGQYLTEKEKKEKQVPLPTDLSFANIFSQIIEKNVMDSKLRQEIRSDFNSMELSLAPEIIKKSSNWGEITEDAPSSSKAVLANSRCDDLTDNEKNLLFNEFRSRVFSDFLGGKDIEFDYSSVDDNADYDDLTMWENDQQDDYFDAESPKIVQDDDTNESI